MERDTVAALDRLIYGAMAVSLTRSGSRNVDLAETLSDADPAAFEAMGTPEEIARRVLARVQKIAPATSARQEETRFYEETVPNGPRTAGAADPEYADLLARHDACHQATHFEWDQRFSRELRGIGQGGQGIVYRIKSDNKFNASWALKILSPQPYSDARSYRQDMERMCDVAAAVQQIYHDNIIFVEQFRSHQGIYVMVMRVIDGFDLQRLLSDELVGRLKDTVTGPRWSELHRVVFARCGAGRRGLTPGVAVNIIEKGLRGVGALHNENIVHCDIKPSNIMLDCHGSIRLIDIGSAFQLGARPQPHAWTPRYAPPEVLESNEWTPQGDLASLGYVLIELLSGQPDLLGPPVGSSSVHGLDRKTRDKLLVAKRQLPDRLRELIPPVAQESKRLMDLCNKLIRPNPRDRFASAEEAYEWTAKFKDDLVLADLTTTWVKVIKYWVMDANRAMSGAAGD